MPKVPPSHSTMFLLDGVDYTGTFGVFADQQTELAEESRPDPNWSYVDSKEHFHAFDSMSKEAPTLTTRSRDVPCNGACGQSECDGFSEVNYFCRICDELVKPRFVKSVKEVVVAVVHGWGARVRGPMLQPGTTVSVRINQDGLATRFGIARVGEVNMSSGDAFAELELHGIGRLGFLPTS